MISGCGGGDSAVTNDSVANDPYSNLITYTPRQNISNTSTYSSSETFTISSDGVIHTFWIEDGEILYSSSVDNGNTFQPPKVVVTLPLGYRFDYAKAAHTANAIHLTWTVYATNPAILGAEIFHIRSMDGGNSFTDPLLVSIDDGLNSYASSISTDVESKVSITWSNEDVGSNRTRFVVSIDEGGTFTTPSSLPTQQGLSPSMLMTPSALYASWMEGAEFTQELYFAGSTDGGMSFSTPMNISQNPQKSWAGEIAQDDAGTTHANRNRAIIPALLRSGRWWLVLCDEPEEPATPRTL